MFQGHIQWPAILFGQAQQPGGHILVLGSRTRGGKSKGLYIRFYLRRNPGKNKK
jgi:hypothetical protein